MHAKKIAKVQDTMKRMSHYKINDSEARELEGMGALSGYGHFLSQYISLGVIPQISVILGPCAGGAVYSPALTDFVLRTTLANVHYRTTG